MIRRPSYWLWRWRVYWIAHLAPEWHRYYKTEIASRRKAHKPTRDVQSEYTRRVHAALRQELGK